MTTAEGGSSHKLWGGRFSGGPAPELEAVNRSIGVDVRLWPHDIRLSQAWALALAEAGVISQEDGQQLVTGLHAVASRIADGVHPLATDEDVHTLIDRLLHEEVGDVASRLHTGRSRNDQVATATRLWCMTAAARVDGLVRELQTAMVDQAGALGAAIMPAYTHMQRAQPILAAHWMLSHFWPLHRDRQRLRAARQSAATLPLGSGAVAGSAFAVSRESLRRELGFDHISQNSVDAVSDRDFAVDLAFALGLLATHLSRLAEDLILFGSSEFGFVLFGDAFSTGSSMMPQKRNPDALELARGSSARVLGDVVALVATLKGLPTGYNKDLQEDKRALFDAVDCLELLLPAVAGTLRTLTFVPGRMESAVTSVMMATDLADYLVRRGVAFRDAHAAVGRLVRIAEERRVELDALPMAEFTSAHAAFDDDVRAELSARTSIAHRDLPGGTAAPSVAQQLSDAKATLSAT